MGSTRELVLENLLKRRRCTINDLAEAVEINPISVRHHITKLEAEGLVASEEERHGVGRPRRVYFLTDEGMELFPTRYLLLARRLLEQLKETLPDEMVDKVFAQIAADMAEEHVAEIDLTSLTHEERMELLKQLLAQEGFTVDIERQEDKYLIRETSCPYYHVGQEHPEVCIVDRTLISTVLSAPVEKIKCMLDGDAHCTYEVPYIAATEIKEMSELQA